SNTTRTSDHYAWTSSTSGEASRLVAALRVASPPRSSLGPQANFGEGHMSRLLARTIATVLASGVLLTLGSRAVPAPIGALKQFKVPTADSQPRAITNGPDGNRWFTEGTELTSARAHIARITPARHLTGLSR